MCIGMSFHSIYLGRTCFGYIVSLSDLGTAITFQSHLDNETLIKLPNSIAANSYSDLHNISCHALDLPSTALNTLSFGSYSQTHDKGIIAVTESSST